MTQQDAFALSRSNLNGFLFADIGVEPSGMQLSVISALARQGLDPWQEAERLSKQPRKAATDGLARLIAAMPASLWSLPDATVIAARLVALLPRHVTGDEDPPTASNFDLSLPPKVKQNGPWLILAILTIVLLAGIGVFVAPTPAASVMDPIATTSPSPQVPTGG